MIPSPLCLALHRGALHVRYLGGLRLLWCDRCGCLR